MRTIVVGDIHGCVDEFRELVGKISLQDDDRLVLLGDLIDKGPDSAGVVEYARRLDAECIMGNHEEKALRWMVHERRKQDNPRYRNPMRMDPSKPGDKKRLDQWFAISESGWVWLSKLPFFLKINDKWSAVHAGCLPGLPLDKQDRNHLMRMRYVNSNRLPSGYFKYKMAPLNERGELVAPPAGMFQDHWTKIWEGPENIAYGHYIWDEVHHTTQSKEGHHVQTLGLDTGCVHGGFLTAAIFAGGKSEFELVQVKARQTYSERKPWNESED
jgi:bis(5'-nucleosyl)-tetraphosphatase (symmetrical)